MAAEPIRLEIANIRFKDGKLWQPRYESLIDYTVASQSLQFEPAFMVASEERDQKIELVFGIEATEDVEFYVEPDGHVRQDFLALTGTPGVSVVLENSRSCKVVWTRSGDQRSLMSLRIACRHPKVEPSDALDLTEGGVYLVIIDPGARSDHDPEPVQAAPRSNGAVGAGVGTVRLLGIDEHNRPVYDLFRGDVPRELVREPAFRAAHGEQLDFTLALDIPGAAFQVDEQGEPVWSFFIPGTWHVSLAGTALNTDRTACTIHWRRPEKRSQEDRTKGTTSFDLFLDLAAFESPIRIDPTVIEPPPCDANGVCSPPRNWGPGGGSAG